MLNSNSLSERTAAVVVIALVVGVIIAVWLSGGFNR
jgi:hypothetical protein